MTMRHLASMASGHDREMMEEAVARDPQEPVRGFLLMPPDQRPGTVFAYSQPCTYAAGSIIQRAAGMPLTEYLRPRLFDPLGIGEVGWLTWPPGREQGFSGLFARTEDIAKLGQLYLQRGRWDGSQLMPGTTSRRRRRGRSTPRTSSPIPTGARATASSSGCPGTATAATAPSGSSASCCPSRTPWSP